MPTRLPGRFLFLAIPLVCLAPAYAQSGTVAGRILDVETAMPVMDVELGIVDAGSRFSPVGLGLAAVGRITTARVSYTF